MLLSCGGEILSEDKTIDGINLPKGTTVYFYEDGSPWFIRTVEQTMINGLKIPSEAGVLFYEQERGIQAIRLYRTAMIQSLPLEKNLWNLFYPNGNFKKIKLAPKFEESDTSDTKLYSVYYTPAGLQAKLVETPTQHDLEESEPTKEQILQTNPRISGWVEYYENGTLKSITLAAKGGIQDYPADSGAVSFYENGMVKSLALATQITIADYPIEKGALALYETGQIQQFTLFEDRKLMDVEGNALEKKAGDTICLDEQGTVINCK